MKTVKFLSFVAGLGLLFTGCVGPAGAPGPTGPQGPAGNNGVPNINIQQVSVPSGAWTYVASPGYYYAVYNDGAITDPNNEAVLVYVSDNSSSGPWQTLPCSHLWNSGDQVVADWTTDNVTLNYDYTSLSNVPATVYFNIVVIPPAIMKRHPGTNWKDGAAVLTLPEMQAAMHTVAQ